MAQDTETKTTIESNDISSFLEKFDRHFSGFQGASQEADKIFSVLQQKTAANVFLTGEKGSGKTALISAIAQDAEQNTAEKTFSVPASLKNKKFIFIHPEELFKTNKKHDIERHLNSLITRSEQEQDTILVVENLPALLANLYNFQLRHVVNRLITDLHQNTIQMIAMSNETQASEIREVKTYMNGFDDLFTHVSHTAPNAETVEQILRSTRSMYQTTYPYLDITDEAEAEIVKLTHKIDASLYKDLAQPERSLRVRDMIISVLADKILAHATEQKDDKLEKLEEKKRTLTQQLHRAIHIAQNSADQSAQSNAQEQISGLKARLPELEEEITAYAKSLSANDAKYHLDKKDVLETFSTLTGVNVRAKTKEELLRIKNSKDILEQRVQGQEHVTSKVASSFQRSQMFKKKKGKPIASYLFIGPSGVGKTELAKALSELMTGDADKGLVFLNMAEYKDQTALNKMVGAPAGYAGYEDGGALTNAVSQQSNSVVLFDELEKASPEIFDIALSILDEGKIKDNKGKDVDFSDTVVIMTSNYLAKEFENTSRSFDETAEYVKKRMREADSPFRPEFLNRFTDIVFFQHLDNEIMYKIIQASFDKTSKELEEEGVYISTTAETIKDIVNAKYSPEHGVRVAKQYVTNKLEEAIVPACQEAQFAAIEAGSEEEFSISLRLEFNKESNDIEIVSAQDNSPKNASDNTQEHRSTTMTRKAACKPQ